MQIYRIIITGLISFAMVAALCKVPAYAVQPTPEQIESLAEQAARLPDLDLIQYNIRTTRDAYRSCADIVIQTTITNNSKMGFMAPDYATEFVIRDAAGKIIQPSGQKAIQGWSIPSAAVPAGQTVSSGTYPLADQNYLAGDCKPGVYKITGRRAIRIANAVLESNTITILIR
jgi:hypothetical protein